MGGCRMLRLTKIIKEWRRKSFGEDVSDLIDITHIVRIDQSGGCDWA
ncbi:hypothetical protein A2U01_0034338, partial [Trifolium medium]|nr:hypothetical protein [Trifolium medium]